MANTNLSANMNLPIPVPGVQSGPQYAININDCLTLLDQHNHTPGFGAPIVSAALDINDDLPVNDHNITLIRTARFSSQNAALVLASDLRCIYVIDQDLYFNDGSGIPVRITQFGNVAGTPGSIANLVSPASASYVSGSTKFVFQSDVNTAANIDAGAILLRNLTASSFALTLSPPTLSSNYSITLPALPAASKILTMDSSGAQSAATDVDNSTIEIASNLIRVKASGITSTQIASGAVIMKSQTFTANGSFTVPAGITNVLAFGCGGGGGGGAGGNTNLGGTSGGGAGGGGAQARIIGISVTPGDVIGVFVGAGGSGGTSGGNGTAGGNTVFASRSWRGGPAGFAGQSTNPGGGISNGVGGGGNGTTVYSSGSGAGGTAGGAPGTYSGSVGGEGWEYGGGAGGTTGLSVAGGGGGGAGYGGAGGAGGVPTGVNVAGVAGSPGLGYGAGGGGGSGGSGSLATPGAGGVGYQGFITIYWVDRA